VDLVTVDRHFSSSNYSSPETRAGSEQMVERVGEEGPPTELAIGTFDILAVGGGGAQRTSWRMDPPPRATWRGCRR
jgi:hypothetical protein